MSQLDNIPNNIDHLLKNKPEFIEPIITAFQIYANKNDLNLDETIGQITSLSLPTLNKKRKKYKRSLTPYGSIKPPYSPYIIFMRENFNRIQKKYNIEKPVFKDMSKHIATEWHNLDPKIKAKYIKLSDNDKDRYRKEKDEVSSIKKPKRPMSPFMFFLQEFRKETKKNISNITSTEISKLAKVKWSKMSYSDRYRFDKLFHDDKKRYYHEKEVYLSKLTH